MPDIQRIYDPLNHHALIVRAVKSHTNGHVSDDLASVIADSIIPYVTAPASPSMRDMDEIVGMIEIGEKSGQPVAQGVAVAARDALMLVGAARAANAPTALLLDHMPGVVINGHLSEVWGAFCNDRKAEAAAAKDAVAQANKEKTLAEVALARQRHNWRTFVTERGIVGIVLSTIFGNVHEKRGVFNLMFVVAIASFVAMLIAL